MLNNVVLLGRATKDPQLFKTGDDSNMCLISLAFDNLGKEATTSFIDVKLFGKVADSAATYLRKGHKCAITGRLLQENFERKDGTKGSRMVIIADSVEFLEPKKAEETEEESKPNETPEDYHEEPKFDPYTGKPLKSNSKK